MSFSRHSELNVALLVVVQQTDAANTFYHFNALKSTNKSTLGVKIGLLYKLFGVVSVGDWAEKWRVAGSSPKMDKIWIVCW